jgi:hypothetical protein
MKEKHILKSIKKVVLHKTPKHLPFLEKEIVVRRKPRFWQIIPVATFAASAIVIALVSTSATPSEVNNSSSTSTPSEVNSSGPNVRRPISEMMAELVDNSYTLRYVFDDVTFYTYEVAETLIKITIPDSYTGNDSSQYLDITDANSPYIYQQIDGETWYVSSTQPYELLSLISPLSFIDPSAVEDEWFIWNETMEGYDLNPTYLPNLFENSPLQGVEDVEVWMTIEGEIVLSFGGRMHEDSDQHASLQLVYGNFGTTTVTLPSNAIDFRSVAINELLNGSTNHRYQYYFTPISDEPNALPFTYQLGERDGDTFKQTHFHYDASYTSAVVDTYFTISNGQYIKVVSDDLGYRELFLDESSYQLALENFYPINLLDVEESWLDVDNETFLENFGANGYPILPDYLDRILNLNVEGTIENVVAHVSLSQNYWQGGIVTLYATLTIDGLDYQLFFEVTSFDQVQGIFMPYSTGIRTTFADTLALAVGTSSYSVEQLTINEDGNSYPANDAYFLVRSGQDYQRYRVNAQGFLDLDYFGQQGGEYFSFSYVYNLRDYVRETIDQATYEANVVDTEWIKLENIQPEDYQANPAIPGGYTLSASSFERIFADALLDQYTITDAVISYTNLYEASTMIVFSLTGIDRVTGETVRFESRYSFIGESVIYFPTPIEEENPTDQADPYDLAITFETFNELYPDGINSFIGTLYAFNDMGDLILLEVFSLQENEALTINRMDGEYTQIVRDGENFIQTQGNTVSSETVMTSTDAATFEEASTSLSFIDFSLFNATNLVSLDVNVSFGVIYQVNLDSFDELFNLPLSETMEVTDAYLEITKNYLSVSVYGFDQETGQNFTMYLVLESLNLNVDLLSYLQ